MRTTAKSVLTAPLKKTGLVHSKELHEDHTFWVRHVIYVLAYYAFTLGVRVLANLAFPDCDHPTNCFDLSAELSVNRREDVHPCENFYDYVCGRWRRNYPRDPNQFHVLQTRLNVALFEKLDGDLDPDSAMGKMGIGMLKCMNVYFKKEDHTDVVRKFFADHNMRWPLTQTMSTESLLDLLVGLSLVDFIGPIFLLDDAPYLRTDDRYVVMVVAGNAAPYSVGHSLNVVAECTKPFHPSSEGFARLIVRVEQEFLSLSFVHRPYDDSPHYDSYKALDNITGPSIKGETWVRSINKHLPRIAAVHVDDELFLKDRYILTVMKDMLAKIEVPEILLYIGWRIVAFMSIGTSYHLMTCQTGLATWDAIFLRLFSRCESYLRAVAPYAILHLQLDSVVTEATVAYADRVTKHIRETLAASFNYSWMDETSARGAADRLRKISEIVGWPRHLRAQRDVDDYYAYVPRFHDRPFMDSLLDAFRAKTKQAMRLLALEHSPVRRVDWEISHLMVNAMYVSVYHLIVIPAPILMPPFFIPDESDAVNFGCLGKIVGHEFMHAFDPNWARISDTGEVQRWYTNTTKYNYLARLQCLADQVNNVTGSKTLGWNSIDENIGDNAGTEITFLAYQRIPRGLESHDRIAGLTQDEAFFATGCLLLCNEDKTVSDPNEAYPSSEVRCNIPCINTEQFGRAFSCRKGAPMRPERRCDFS